ncbi:Protein-L-isoaspartate O-methyltransferase [Tepidimonas thermarum]|uniref:Protein-L-isoaspartate O-methyltransferase n=1 Tax=Tepidimonas thermarum TaxID=335431 RepID=A0A554WXY7_9BURK|nr:protein-L-isoaspartate(D-aspartate) O-methyltransferase [Tepidimonas thermarum]TSE28421.1 Protein-L-isoaspartate O-methyltransferase [Tepidimonas thermarum]
MALRGAGEGGTAPRRPHPPEHASGVGLDSAAVRHAMVQRLAQQGLRHEAVLHALAAVERHRFVDTALVAQAYEDTALPIGWGQTISKPSVVARMLELLCEGRALPLGRVLEIGTGCGYQAALLARLCQEVYSMERLRALHERARENLRPLRIPNVHLIFGDGTAGFPAGAPYAGIIAAAGGDDIPSAWLQQLTVGARLVAPAELEPGRQHLVVVERTERGYERRVLESVWFVPLKSGTA